MTLAAIEIDDIAKHFRTGNRTVTALDRVSARVAPSQVTGLVGPDGAGKTTLMRLIAGILRPDAGSIRVLGMDSVQQARNVQAIIGYMPQRFGLYEDLSVSENLNLYADLHGLTGDSRQRRLRDLTEFAGLEQFRRRLAGHLSGGMKQKLGLACALISEPQFLLLDEPSVGVDPLSRRELWEIVNVLVEQGVTVLWSTAYLDEAERCESVLLLNEGRLLQSGPPDRFSAMVKGRTFRVRLETEDRRGVLQRVRANPEVLDATMKGPALRVLLSDGASPSALKDILAGESGAHSTPSPVEPEFEDAFVALLMDLGNKPSPVRNADGDEGLDVQFAAEAAPTRKSKTRPVSMANSIESVGPAVIDVSDLVRDFGAFRAVDRVNFQVAKGEIFGLLGPNGAGKSTTFKMLCGLLPPSGGSAKVLGIDIRRAPAVARARIGYMAQKFSLYGGMSVRQNLHFFASAYGLSGDTRQSKIDWALDEFDLRRYCETGSGNLPLGYKQRLALACAIMHHPGVLFLDEPTSGVDPLVRRSFWNRINAMSSAGVAVMVTTHFMDEAEYCDRIGIIYRGRLIELGSPDTLRKQHSSPDNPDPSLDDTFVNLIKAYDREQSS